MTDRYLDLLKQGFMKPLKTSRKAAVKVQRPIVACSDCMNWHRQGKHTADIATRNANRIKNAL